jgi:hypothetical protein
MSDIGPGIPDHLRQRLLRKARILLDKTCASARPGGCLEGFVAHQLRQGRAEVVAELAAMLRDRCRALEQHDPASRLETTRRLLQQLELRLEADTGKPASTD